MAKPKSLDGWGRATAKKRYAEGGAAMDEGVEDRPSEVDQFIKAVMREQMAKMADNGKDGSE